MQAKSVEDNACIYFEVFVYDAVIQCQIPCFKRDHIERSVLVVFIMAYITLIGTTYVITTFLRFRVVKWVTTDISRKFMY